MSYIKEKDNYLHPNVMLHKFPSYLSNFFSEKKDNDFRLFISWRSNRDFISYKNLIKYILNKTNISITVVWSNFLSEDELKDVKNKHNLTHFKKLTFIEFLKEMSKCNLNVTILKQINHDWWDTTNLIWLILWIPSISNVAYKTSQKYILKNESIELLLDSNSIDSYIKKIDEFRKINWVNWHWLCKEYYDKNLNMDTFFNKINF